MQQCFGISEFDKCLRSHNLSAVWCRSGKPALTLASDVLIVSTCLLAGSYIPPRRAAKIDPMVALRYK